MEGEAIFDRSGKFTTHSQMFYAVFVCGGQAKSIERDGTGLRVSRGAVSEDKESMVSMLFCLLSGAKIKRTRLRNWNYER